LGFDDTEDELFKYAEFHKNIEPLYLKTEDWREKLEDKDGVEIKIKGKWLEGTVKETDFPHGRIEIEYESIIEDNDLDTSGSLTNTIDSTDVNVDLLKESVTAIPMTSEDAVLISSWDNIEDGSYSIYI
jgi:hypothetical protein